MATFGYGRLDHQGIFLERAWNTLHAPVNRARHGFSPQTPSTDPNSQNPPKAPRRVGSSDGPASDSFIRLSVQIVPLADARAWSPIGVLAPGPGPSFRGPSRMFERRSSADGRPRPVDVSGKTGRAFSASGGERLRALKKKLRLKLTKRHNTWLRRERCPWPRRRKAPGAPRPAVKKAKNVADSAQMW